MEHMDIFKGMADRWPSSVVARSAVGQFTGGAVSPKTMANLDCRGEGPAQVVRVGGKVCYPTAIFIEWLERRTTTRSRPK